MTERGPNNEQNELTNQPNSSNLEKEGEIFMAEGNNNDGPEHRESDQPESQENISHSEANNTREPDATGAPTPESSSSREDQERLDREAAQRKSVVERDLGPVLGSIREALLANGVALDRIAEIMGDVDPRIAGERVVAETNQKARVEGRGQIGVPNSLEDLSELIMKSSAPEWGRDGKKALIYKDKEGRDRVNVVNFLDWSRSNMLRVHNANPTSPINFFSDIGTSVRNDVWGSQISFYEIVFTESMFMDKVVENGKEVTKKNDDYEALKKQLLMEVFLFSVTRNPDITYFANRGQGEQMLKALGEAFAINPLTRGDFFEFIFTMPSMHKKSLKDMHVKEGNEMQAKQESNFYMGDAAREALAAYMNIFDYQQLIKIFGEDAPLFRMEYENWDAETGERKKDKTTGRFAADKTIVPDVHDPESRKRDWFNEDGSVKRYAVDKKGRYIFKRVNGLVVYQEDPNGSPHPEYMAFINPFLSPTPDQRQQTEARERIILSIMKKNGISYREAQIAELWAFSMTHTHGVAAEMDTDAVAFDWWTRLVRSKEYRKRQKADRRGAPYGGNHNIEGFKRLGLTFFEAARDIEGRSIKSIIQGGTGSDVGIENMPFKDKLDFERDEKGNIVFKQGGQVATGILARDYEIYDQEITLDNGQKQRKTAIRFLDANGQVVEVGEATPTETIIKAESVRFKADLQKQFLPNHMHTAAGVYEFIMKQVGLNLPELVTGYDTRGNPIIDQEKLLEIKAKIEHDIRYSLSTWPEINFSEKDLRAERLDVRNSKGKLVARKRGPNDEELELDEEWYILDKNGKRTQERNEPETYLRSRETTILESMFGTDALEHIQFEIERHGLATGTEVIVAEDERGKRVAVDISEAKKSDAFRIAVWQGAFDYLIAAEIDAHRDRNSGLRYYDSTDIKKASDAMIVGELATPDRVSNIRKESNTRARRVYSQDIAYAFATGGVVGAWKIFQIMLKDILNGK